MTPLDALLVLGGEDRAQWPRCRRALQVYREHCRLGLPPPRLIVSGGKLVRHGGRRVSEAALMAEFLQGHGVPGRDILMETLALDTLGNVVLGRELALRHGLERLALVTDDFHHWRSRRLYRRVAGAEPLAVFATGVAGTLRARARERLAFWSLAVALRARGVAPGSLGGHRRFLSGRVAAARAGGRHAGAHANANANATTNAYRG